MSATERRAREAFNDIPGVDRVSLLGSSWDDSRRLYEVSSPAMPGDFYILESESLSLYKLTSRREGSPLQRFADAEEIIVETRDGLELEGYLSLPASHDPDSDEQLPFVIMPHGGPWARDYGNFDNLAQFINAMGIGIIKVNFRGSTGYGTEFEEMGVGEWGRAMQEDLNDAYRYLIERGIADPSRVCMVGWSYGGYASLMASIQDSDKYRCAGSVAGVTDLSALLRGDPGDETLRRIGAKGQFDHGAVQSVSPFHRIDEIAIPVFIAHGTDDRVVPFDDHYKSFLNRLKYNRKDVEHVAFRFGNHSLTAWTDRTILYMKLGAFLEKHLLSN